MNNPTWIKCDDCGFLAEVISAGTCRPVCGDKELSAIPEHTEGEGNEKHIPVPEKRGTSMRVRIGSAAHPMLPAHHIEWIAVSVGDFFMRRHLRPDGAPEADFPVPCMPGMKIYAYCNIHGLWSFTVPNEH